MEQNNIRYMPLLVLTMLVSAFITQFFIVKVDVFTSLFSLPLMLMGLYISPLIIILTKYIKRAPVKKYILLVLIIPYAISFFYLATLFKKGELFVKDGRIHWDTYLIVSKDIPFAIANILDTATIEKLSVFDFDRKEFSILPDSNTYVQSFRIFSPNGNKVLYQTTSSELVVYDIKTKETQKIKISDGVYYFLDKKYTFSSNALPRMFGWIDSRKIVFTCARNVTNLENRQIWAYCITDIGENSMTISQNIPPIYKGEITQYYSLKNGLQKATTWDMDTYNKHTQVLSPDGSQSIAIDNFLRGWDGSTNLKIVWSDSRGNKKDIYRGPIPTGVYWTYDNHVFVTLIGEIRKIK
jgi:hypothetical protein